MSAVWQAGHCVPPATGPRHLILRPPAAKSAPYTADSRWGSRHARHLSDLAVSEPNRGAPPRREDGPGPSGRGVGGLTSSSMAGDRCRAPGQQTKTRQTHSVAFGRAACLQRGRSAALGVFSSRAGRRGRRTKRASEVTPFLHPQWTRRRNDRRIIGP